nr:splicing factor 3b subunit 3 [Cryptomonas sp.]
MHIGFTIAHQNTLAERLIYGNFSGFSKQEIIISRGPLMEIFILKINNGKLIPSLVINFFTQIVFHTSFRFVNEEKDYLFVCDLKGKISVIEIKISWDFIVNDYIRLKNFSRKRVVMPLNFAFDEKKLIFMMCGAGQTKIISYIKKSLINLPLISKEAIEVKHRSIICYYIIHIENEAESKFACIETSYNRPYDKFLVFYFVFISNKNVRRKVICRINCTSYFLVNVPKLSNQEETILVFSENFFTMINPNTLNSVIKNLPYRKKKTQNKPSVIVSTSIYKGLNRMFYLLITQDSDLLQMNISQKFEKKTVFLDIKIEYLDSIKGDIRCGCILPNGFLFLSMESGNHLYLQLLSISKTNCQNNHIYFYPRFAFENVLLVEEFLQNSPILSADLDDFINSIQPQILLLCGTRSKSSIRLLSHSYSMSNICFEQLETNPVGINIIKIEKSLNFVLVSFEKTTRSFLLNKKLEEINSNYFIADSQSILGEYINSRGGIIQVTNKTLRFIGFNDKKRKICEWRPPSGEVMTDSVIFERSIVHVFVIISSSKGILIEILNDGSLIELDNINLENISLMSLFGVSIKTKKWNFLIILGKTEKSVRSYTISKTRFIKLTSIQLISWSPESAKTFFRNGELFLLMSLNNGILIEAKLDVDNGQLKSQNIIKISNFPLYISQGSLSSSILLFGSKVWLFSYPYPKNRSIKLINENQFDLVECSENTILAAKKNNIEIWKNENSSMQFSNFFTIGIPSTPIDLFSFLYNNEINLISFVCSDVGFKFFSHQMVLSKSDSNFLSSTCLSKETEHKRSTVLFLSSIFQLLNKKISYDFILFRGSESNKYWNNVFSKKTQNSTDIIITSSVYINHLNKTYTPMTKFVERQGRLPSLTGFYVNKKTKYNNIQGGRKKSEYKLNYIFETILFCKYLKSSNCFLSKKLLANRFMICIDNLIAIIEINAKCFQKIFEFNGSSMCISGLDVKKNRILTIDSIEGFKIFDLKYKKKSYELLGEKMDLNYILSGKILDPLTIIISGKHGGIFFYRLTKRYFCVDNLFPFNKKKLVFILISCFYLISPVKEILFLKKSKLNKHFSIFLICLDGTLINLKPILKQKDVLFLEKIYTELNSFCHKNRIYKSNQKNFEVDLNAFNLDKIDFFLK